jgi:hypothetical protein
MIELILTLSAPTRSASRLKAPPSQPDRYAGSANAAMRVGLTCRGNRRGALSGDSRGMPAQVHQQNRYRRRSYAGDAGGLPERRRPHRGKLLADLI